MFNVRPAWEEKTEMGTKGTTAPLGPRRRIVCHGEQTEIVDAIGRWNSDRLHLTISVSYELVFIKYGAIFDKEEIAQHLEHALWHETQPLMIPNAAGSARVVDTTLLNLGLPERIYWHDVRCRMIYKQRRIDPELGRNFMKKRYTSVHNRG